MKRIHLLPASFLFNSGGVPILQIGLNLKLNGEKIFHSEEEEEEEEIVVKLKLLKLVKLANFWPKFRSTPFLENEKLKQSQPLRDLPRNQRLVEPAMGKIQLNSVISIIYRSKR